MLHGYIDHKDNKKNGNKKKPCRRDIPIGLDLMCELRDVSIVDKYRVRLFARVNSEDFSIVIR